MTELTWFEGYQGQSTDELLALEGQYRTDSIVLAFEQAVQEKAESLGPDALSVEELTILAVEALEREVNNGGYHQFFVNESQYAPVVVDALKRIGCHAVAALTQEAIDTLAIGGELTPEAIEDVIHEDNDERDEHLSECDSRYYEQAGDLAGPLLAFIRRDRDKIKLSA